MTILALGCVLDDWIVLATLLRLRCSVLRGWLAHFSLFGCYYVICNCNVANIGVVALYLLERLNDNLYYTLEKLIYWVCIYIVFPAVFFQNFVKCSHEREEGKFSDSQIFHFYENSNCSQCMLLAFEFLLFFFHCTNFQSFVVHQELAQSVKCLVHDSMVLLFGFFNVNFELTRVHYYYIF